ncbi:unnamed protein product [Heligmosomoides polygyrus]|uniref:G patch domain-containing protein 11 n=1 Tax=Heligmosomoides polygyrus TaxID=6339 RepID=A0A183G4U6_HELPZ|nr:unnamed protein product [Heligmosomoides polygyrus]
MLVLSVKRRIKPERDKFIKVTGTETSLSGLATSREHKRWLKMEAEKQNEKHEKTLREEALSKPVPETSRGFALMAKMGFKPGMSLGKKKDENDLGSGIKEPIPVEVRSCRTGLGLESDREQQAKQRLQREMDRMKRRAEQHVELMHDYQKRKREVSNTRDLIRDILSSRKICVELDLRMDIELPKESWFWKSYPERKDDCSEAVKFGRTESDEDDFFFCSSLIRVLVDFFVHRLDRITYYLRETHRYCIWCGCQFENQEEFDNYCPGQDRQAHSSIDE